jgi:segregation and condensation protein A
MQFFSVEEAAERLGRMLGIAIDWQTLEAFLPAGLDRSDRAAVGACGDLRGRPAACERRTDRAAPDRAFRSHPLAQTE